MAHHAADNRYDAMPYRRCGKWGLKLPAISLGLWHNFGDADDYQNARAMALRAFDLGVTHFDLANNYGPTAGSAEINFGRILREDLPGYRDELLISTKAGHYMWPGPYGDLGTRKYLLASLDQSLERMGLEYVDIFYSHRPDADTPIEETMSALAHAYHTGKALYVGISMYTAEQTRAAVAALRELNTPCLIHQPNFSMINRWVETEGLDEALAAEGLGGIAFCPLAQGLLTDKYLGGVPGGSRAARQPHLQKFLTEQYVELIGKLNAMAKDRGQSMAQMALAWVLGRPWVTSALIGASKVSQVEDCVGALDKLEFSDDEAKTLAGLLESVDLRI